jgi:hypothetical protein
MVLYPRRYNSIYVYNVRCENVDSCLTDSWIQGYLYIRISIAESLFRFETIKRLIVLCKMTLVWRSWEKDKKHISEIQVRFITYEFIFTFYFLNLISYIPNKNRKSYPTEQNLTWVWEYRSYVSFLIFHSSWFPLESGGAKTVWQTSVPLVPGINKCKIEYCDNRESSVFIGTKMLAGRPRYMGSVIGRDRVFLFLTQFSSNLNATWRPIQEFT